MSTYTAATVPPRFVEANGICFAYRRWDMQTGDDAREAVTLREAPYVPRKDVYMAALTRDYIIPIGATRSIDAVWIYEAPYPASPRCGGASPSIANASIPSRSGLRPE
jgi:hypothetical protein